MPHSQQYSNSWLIAILGRTNPIPRTDTIFYKIQSNILSYLYLDLPICLFPAGLPVKN
jgi:hypothetical protein